MTSKPSQYDFTLVRGSLYDYQEHVVDKARTHIKDGWKPIAVHIATTEDAPILADECRADSWVGVALQGVPPIVNRYLAFGRVVIEMQRPTTREWHAEHRTCPRPHPVIAVTKRAS